MERIGGLPRGKSIHRPFRRAPGSTSPINADERPNKPSQLRPAQIQESAGSEVAAAVRRHCGRTAACVSSTACVPDSVPWVCSRMGCLLHVEIFPQRVLGGCRPGVDCYQLEARALRVQCGKRTSGHFGPTGSLVASNERPMPTSDLISQLLLSPQIQDSGRSEVTSAWDNGPSRTHGLQKKP